MSPDTATLESIFTRSLNDRDEATMLLACKGPSSSGVSSWSSVSVPSFQEQLLIVCCVTDYQAVCKVDVASSNVMENSLRMWDMFISTFMASAGSKISVTFKCFYFFIGKRNKHEMF